MYKCKFNSRKCSKPFIDCGDKIIVFPPNFNGIERYFNNVPDEFQAEVKPSVFATIKKEWCDIEEIKVEDSKPTAEEKGVKTGADLVFKRIMKDPDYMKDFINFAAGKLGCPHDHGLKDHCNSSCVNCWRRALERVIEE